MVKMQQTSFNMCSFIQPSFIPNMLDGNDPDAFNDRQFLVCPEEVGYIIHRAQGSHGSNCESPQRHLRET